MQLPLSVVKILKTEFESQILSEQWLRILLSGNFHGFENLLYEKTLVLYNNLCEELISYVSHSEEFLSQQQSKAKALGLKKLVSREVSIQLRTGIKVKFDSLYAKVIPKKYDLGTRHLSLLIWQCEGSISPMYKSLNCLLSVLCPSFEISRNLLNYQGVAANFERTRQLSLSLAEQCMTKRASVQLGCKETLSGKRVIIGMDGGRTRTRVYKEGKIGRKEKFDTPWREPKLFVITTCDEQGNVNKETKSIYDGSFGDDETFDLLAKYLENLEIEKAKDVHFLADGAPWIWNRVKPMLLKLGVAEDKIIETLDYYHAMEHLHEMKIYMDKDKKDTCFEKLKEALWQGDFGEMTRLIKEGIKGVNLAEFNPFKYFEKQKNRIDYQSLKSDKRPCGSGVIESGIRRIINLRFKSPSTFWYPENMEKLMLMRAIALSGRWEIMMNNLFQK